MYYTTELYNEMMLSIRKDNDSLSLVLYISGGGRNRLNYDDMETVVQQLHKHCITWRSGALVQV